MSMRHSIPILLVSIALCSCANNAEKLTTETAAINVEKPSSSSEFARVALFTDRYNYYQLERIKLQGRADSESKKATEKDNAKTARNPIHCLNNLSPTFCWSTDMLAAGNNQLSPDLAFRYFRNSAPVNEDECAKTNEPCGKLYNQDLAFINIAKSESPGQPTKITSSKSEIKFEPFSISIKY